MQRGVEANQEIKTIIPTREDCTLIQMTKIGNYDFIALVYSKAKTTKY